MTVVNKITCICNTCGHEHTISEREIAMYRGLISSLWFVLKWCEDKGVHEFSMKDIRHTLGQVNYTRFGDWVYFGGLVYKHEKSKYGINIERCREFFAGRRTIPRAVYKNPVTHTITKDDELYIHQFPHLTAFLDENEQYIARYREPQQTLL